MCLKITTCGLVPYKDKINREKYGHTFSKNSSIYCFVGNMVGYIFICPHANNFWY